MKAELKKSKDVFFLYLHSDPIPIPPQQNKNHQKNNGAPSKQPNSARSAVSRTGTFSPQLDMSYSDPAAHKAHDNQALDDIN